MKSDNGNNENPSLPPVQGSEKGGEGRAEGEGGGSSDEKVQGKAKGRAVQTKNDPSISSSNDDSSSGTSTCPLPNTIIRR